MESDDFLLQLRLADFLENTDLFLVLRLSTPMKMWIVVFLQPTDPLVLVLPGEQLVHLLLENTELLGHKHTGGGRGDALYLTERQRDRDRSSRTCSSSSLAVVMVTYFSCFSGDMDRTISSAMRRCRSMCCSTALTASSVLREETFHVCAVFLMDTLTCDLGEIRMKSDPHANSSTQELPVDVFFF